MDYKLDYGSFTGQSKAPYSDDTKPRLICAREDAKSLLVGKAAHTARMKAYTDEEFEKLLALARPREIHMLRRWWKTYRQQREGKTLVELSAALGLRSETVKLHLSRLSARLNSLDRWRGLLYQIGSEVPPRKLPEVSFACSLHGDQSGKMVETHDGTVLRLGCGCEFIPVRGSGFYSLELWRRTGGDGEAKLPL